MVMGAKTFQHEDKDEPVCCEPFVLPAPVSPDADPALPEAEPLTLPTAKTKARGTPVSANQANPEVCPDSDSPFLDVVQRCCAGDKNALRQLRERVRQACGQSGLLGWVGEGFLSAISAYSGLELDEEPVQKEDKRPAQSQILSPTAETPTALFSTGPDPDRRLARYGLPDRNDDGPRSLIEAYESGHRKNVKDAEAERLVEDAANISVSRLDRDQISKLMEAYLTGHVASPQTAELQRIRAKLEDEGKL